MKIEWKITKDDVRNVKEFYNKHKSNAFVECRLKRNIKRNKPPISKDKVWYCLVSCLLTSQQRSGPKSNIFKFIRTKPYPLAYKKCLAQRDVQLFSKKTISKYQAARFPNDKSKYIAANLTILENGLWSELLSKLKSIQNRTNPESEREIAEYIDKNLKGFGPKQSRNFLQMVGLSRYEIPIDSRITEWLNKFGFPIKLNSSALGDKNYYNFISSGIMKLCNTCRMYPCLLDAAIFASYDGDAWNKKNACH